MNIEQQLANNASSLSEDLAIFSGHITCVCFCLLRACSNLTSSFEEFNEHVLGNRTMETFCLDLLYFMDQENTTELFGSCFTTCMMPPGLSTQSYTTRQITTGKSIDMIQPLLVYSFFNVFVIVLYSLTIFVSIFGKYCFHIYTDY